MRSKFACFEKFMYLFLLPCVGGVGPLTYFDAFIDLHEHPYHIALFEEYHHAHTPFPLPAEVLVQRLLVWQYPQLWFQTNMIATGVTGSGLAHFFHSSLGQGYLLTATDMILFSDTMLSERVPDVVLNSHPAWLPPLEKPPSLSS